MCILNYEFHEFNNEYNEQRFEDLKDFEPTSDKDYTNLLRAVLRNYYYGNYGQNYDYYGNSFPNKCPDNSFSLFSNTNYGHSFCNEQRFEDLKDFEPTGDKDYTRKFN